MARSSNSTPESDDDFIAAEAPSSHVQKADDGFLEGKLLIAMPGMPDPRFEKSVIFICAHSAEGAMGLIVNKPIEGLMFHDLLEKLEIMPQGAPTPPVLFGGPVQIGRGFVLHSAEYAQDGATLPITDTISLTATVDILQAIAAGHGPRQSALALGYAGWGTGQIESEIRANGWIHCDPDPDLVFGTDYDDKWRAALAKLGADISGLSAEAGRA